MFKLLTGYSVPSEKDIEIHFNIKVYTYAILPLATNDSNDSWWQETIGNYQKEFPVQIPIQIFTYGSQW